MLAAHHRLHRSDDFRRAVRRGSRSSRPTMVLHLLPPGGRSERPAPADEPARVGFVVSRGVGPAVVRNRVVRRLRHLVGERLGDLEPGSLLVVRATPRAAGASWHTLGHDLDSCLRSLGRRGSTARTGRSSR